MRRKYTMQKLLLSKLVTYRQILFYLLIDQSKQGLCFELSLGILSVCVYLSISLLWTHAFTDFHETSDQRTWYKGKAT